MPSAVSCHCDVESAGRKEAV